MTIDTNSRASYSSDRNIRPLTTREAWPYMGPAGSSRSILRSFRFGVSEPAEPVSPAFYVGQKGYRRESRFCCWRIYPESDGPQDDRCGQSRHARCLRSFHPEYLDPKLAIIGCRIPIHQVLRWPDLQRSSIGAPRSFAYFHESIPPQ